MAEFARQPLKDRSQKSGCTSCDSRHDQRDLMCGCRYRDEPSALRHIILAAIIGIGSRMAFASEAASSSFAGPHTASQAVQWRYERDNCE